MSGIECGEVLEDIEAYLDGELPGERTRAVEEHLSGCGPCFERGEFRRHLQEILRRKCGAVISVPPHLHRRIQEALGPSAPR